MQHKPYRFVDTPLSKPSSLDAAYELEAIKAGLLAAPSAVFPENRSWGQPPPTPNQSPPIWELVMQDMFERNEFGKAKYGTPLQAHNGRNALKDAYEEVLDLAVYLKQKLVEEQDVR